MAQPTSCKYTSSVTSSAKKVLSDALSLSSEEQQELLAALSDRIDPMSTELSTEWTQELESRLTALERGEVQPVGWDQVQAKIESTLASLR